METTRIIGNCFRCCYATRKRSDGECVCARYPQWTDVLDMHEHFCGEFEFRVWKEKEDAKGDVE